MADKFNGFDFPKENWSKLPHQLIEALPSIGSLGEMKVILYVLRHTWGYQEFDDLKRITLDEFMHGRKRRDGTRLDGGVGMSENTIMAGIKKAVDDGFLLREEDPTPRPGRQSFFYRLNIKSSKVEDSNPQKLRIQSSEVEDSSEKDTIERKGKEREKSISNLPSSDPSILSSETSAGEWDEDVTSALLEVTIEKLARTFRDKAPLQSSITRAYNLWDRTNLDADKFVAAVEAAAETTKGVANVENRMAYFFTVLRKSLELK